ncbi:MAG: enoyl-CoA hydratase/isomerase family protein [Campylobacterales bacterium]|nr:enoyl-CoA hydratase/isomerase family protein [Campylobacterales bacterium]
MNFFDFTMDSSGIATLCFSREDGGVNILSSEALKALDAKLDELKTAKEIRLLKISSAKEGIFIAGADIAEIEGLRDEEEAYEKVREGQKILSKLCALPFPTLSIIDGACLGGGLELALCCDYRICTEDAKTKLGLPEVNLGVLPGFGGTQRLKRLVGLSKALELILGAKILKGKKAEKLGLVDGCVPKGYLAFKEKSFVEEILNHPEEIVKKRPTKTVIERFAPQLIFYIARKNVMAKTKGKYPAPLAVLELFERTQYKEVESGLSEEARAFANLVVGDICKNLIGLFYTSEALKKERGVKRKVNPVRINILTVIGAGVMGSGIVYQFSLIGKLVRMKLRGYEQAGSTMKSIQKMYDAVIKRGRLRPDEAAMRMGHISYTTAFDGFKNCDLLIEAIVENIEAKQELYAQLEAVADEKAIIASNTSSLCISMLSEKMAHPGRFVGMHFFNPVSKMPLVEIIPGKKSSDKTISTVVELVKEAGKTPIVVGDCAGFLVNRILLPYINEAARLCEEGADFERIDRVILDFGMPMGPFALADEVGLDVGYKVAKVLEEAYGERMKVSSILDRVYHQMQLLGKKGGKGFYIHTAGKPKANEEVKNLVYSKRTFEAQEILDRSILIMVNEAAMCLEEKIVENAHYLDMAMVMGTGFPPFRGGLLRYADAIGIERIVITLQSLSTNYGLRFEPARLLQEMARDKKTFY